MNSQPCCDMRTDTKCTYYYRTSEVFRIDCTIMYTCTKLINLFEGSTEDSPFIWIKDLLW